MALFDFLKTAGKKLFDDADNNSHEEPSANAGSNGSEEKIKTYLESLNLGLKTPEVKVEGDKVILRGEAHSQEALEKAVLATGNIHGIAKVENQMTAPQAEQSRFYTVKAGDTLSQISKEMYGNANLYNTIFEANRPLLKNADDIYPGQQLRIPVKESMTA